MANIKLKEDLTNCLINFDRRVLVTELLDDYKVPYEVVNDILEAHLMEQEKTQNLKYEKRYIVHGHQEGDNNKEIYKIVDEEKLKEWLKKLTNAESSLYSVEVAGGAKAIAAVFKPISIQEGVKLRVGHSVKAANGAASTSNPQSIKTETKIESVKTEPQASASKSPTKTIKSTPKKISPKVETYTKKSPKIEGSSNDAKKSKEKVVQKKGINNFFNSVPATKKTEAKTTEVAKPPTPKKMQDFFKKQTEKPKSATNTKATANTSVQLFDEQEEPEEVASSDEEEKLDALKRGLMSSDVEMEDDDGDSTKPSTSKRRRILDSDDEDDDNPPVKQEKLDIKEPEEVKKELSPQLDETYLDDEGFVITKKSKQKGKSTTSKSITTKKSPPVTKKISPKETKKSSSTTAKDSKASSNSSTKTKQAGIMNFFTKK